MTTTKHDQESGLERLRFFPRQVVRADDLNSAHDYHREKLRRHNRFLHGWGVVCGCDVRPAPRQGKPWLLQICPGYLITPQYDEVLIGSEALFDVASCLIESTDPCAFSRPCPPITRRPRPVKKLYLSVRYVECETRPTQVAPAGCTCDEADCEYARVRDAYEFCCLESLPGTHGARPYGCSSLCKGSDILACPGCPDDPWVVLATITLPSVGTEPLAGIDVATDRRRLYSTAMLQEMAFCACGDRT